MIASDAARFLIALAFLVVHRPDQLWIAYVATVLLSFFGAFFEAAKNAAVPNITGERDLLAANALMWSSRFILMSFGAVLGGWTAANFGYKAAFIINALSFIASAYSIWLIPDRQTKQADSIGDLEGGPRDPSDQRSYWSDLREGWSFIITHAPVAAILGVNILWATGGGAVNLISDRLGGIVFVGEDGTKADSAVAALYFAAGLGLFIGMIIARRVGSYVEFVGQTPAFIGWSLIVQGILFALIGLMPNLWLACLFLFAGRVLLGAEFAVQETLLMRLVPDYLRGRVSTTDRATELLVWSFSTAAAGWSLRAITPRTLTVLSGLLSASSGVVWLALFAAGRVRLPRRLAFANEPKEVKSVPIP
jgi:MFS family permease